MKMVVDKTKFYSNLSLSEKYSCDYCIHVEAYKKNDICEIGEKLNYENCGEIIAQDN